MAAVLLPTRACQAMPIQVALKDDPHRRGTVRAGLDHQTGPHTTPIARNEMRADEQVGTAER
jgi:hypothetical protein